MSQARERFRHVLSRPTCTVAANIFDPLSARIAHMLDYEVCFLSGSVVNPVVRFSTWPPLRPCSAARRVRLLAGRCP